MENCGTQGPWFWHAGPLRSHAEEEHWGSFMPDISSDKMQHTCHTHLSHQKHVWNEYCLLRSKAMYESQSIYCFHRKFNKQHDLHTAIQIIFRNSQTSRSFSRGGVLKHAPQVALRVQASNGLATTFGCLQERPNMQTYPLGEILHSRPVKR